MSADAYLAEFNKLCEQCDVPEVVKSLVFEILAALRSCHAALDTGIDGWDGK